MFRNILLLALLGFSALNATPDIEDVPDNGILLVGDLVEPDFDAVPHNGPYLMEPETEGEAVLVIPELDSVLILENPAENDGDVLTLPENSFLSDIVPDNEQFLIDADIDPEDVPNNLPYPMEPQQGQLPEIEPLSIDLESEIEDVPNNLPYPMEPPQNSLPTDELLLAGLEFDGMGPDGSDEIIRIVSGPESDLILVGLEDVPNNLPYPMEPLQASLPDGVLVVVVPETEGMEEDVPNNLPLSVVPQTEESGPDMIRLL